MPLAENARKIVRFGAFRKGDIIVPYLPKYGRIAPHQKPANGL